MRHRNTELVQLQVKYWNAQGQLARLRGLLQCIGMRHSRLSIAAQVTLDAIDAERQQLALEYEAQKQEIKNRGQI